MFFIWLVPRFSFTQRLIKMGKRVAGRKPRFVEFTDGQVVVAGAIKYDPEEEAKVAAKARGASERPE
jgi:hypothetical protein